MAEIRVLLIDDHPIVRSGIRMLLEQAEDILVVAEADRGDDVVQLLRRHTPDIVLLDMEMPGKSGVDVAREIQDAGVPVRILALSAYDDDEYISSLLSNGAAGYLTKEEALHTIVDAVRGVARGEEGWFSRRAAAQVAALARRGPQDAATLTEREEEVLLLLAEGWTNARIAQDLSVSERTVRFHLSNIYDKLGCSSRAEAIAWALRRPSG
jgi:DNA-binding NarL/FixJ family response regulator